MFFSKATFVLSFLALGNIVAAAQTPACLLSVVGAQKDPADLQAVCITNGDDVQKQIADICGDSEQAALTWFADTCDAAGHKVVIKSTTTSGSSATGTPTNGSTSTNTGFVTATATGSSGSSGTGSGKSGTSSSSAASASHTNSAGSSDRQVSAAAFAAVVFFGFAAAL